MITLKVDKKEDKTSVTKLTDHKSQNITIGSDSFNMESLKVETSPQIIHAFLKEVVKKDVQVASKKPNEMLNKQGIDLRLKEIIGSNNYNDLVELKNLHSQYAAQKEQHKEKTNLS